MCASCETNPDKAVTIRNVEVSRPVPEEAKEACEKPVALPDRAISQKEATSLWGRDRGALIECEARRKLAVGE